MSANLLVAAGGERQQRDDNDVPGERGPLLPAAAAAPDFPFAARSASPHGFHLPEPGSAAASPPCQR